MRKTTVLVLIATLGLGACNTASGVAKDVYGGMKYVVKKVGGGNDDRRRED